MLDLMDEIAELVVERVIELPEAAKDIVQTVLCAIAKGVIILTTPIWILPYVMIKQYIEQHEKQ